MTPTPCLCLLCLLPTTLLLASAGGSSEGRRLEGRPGLYQQPNPQRLVEFSSLRFAQFGGAALGYRPLPYRQLNLSWVFAVSVCDSFAYFSTEAVVAASKKYGILTPGLECAGIYQQVKGTKTGAISEWGQEFSAMDYINFPTALCVNHSMASLKLRGVVPHSREEALLMMQSYWRCRMALATAGGNEPKVLELTANMFFGAFAAAMGNVSVVACEINNWNAQEHIAFTRGAARQFGLPWAVDISPWYGGAITDYSTARYWGNSSDPHGGHSLSLYNRSWYSSFMSGAGHLVAEAGAVNLFLQNKSSDGVLNLSPLGEVARDFAHFAHGRVERGIPYVPLAVVLERAHGFGVGLTATWRGYPSTWNGAFRLSASEEIAWALLQALWPGSWFPPADEVLYQVPSPYGDSFDMVPALYNTYTIYT